MRMSLRLRHILPALLLPLLAASCRSTQSEQAVDASSDTARKETVLPPAEAERFNLLFLEAMRQKEASHYDAEHDLLAEALRLNPEAPEALYEMSQLILSFADIDDTLRAAQGESMLRRAVELAPKNTEYKEKLVLNLAKQIRFDEAAELYSDIARENPDAKHLDILLLLQEQNADFEGAIATLNRLETLEGKSERYSIEKFQLYNELGDGEHAYAAIEDLCAQFPTDLRYRVLMGDLYMENGYQEMALATYQDVLTLEPSNSYAQLSLLAYYSATGADSLYQSLLDDVVLNPNTQSEARTEAMRGYVSAGLSSNRDSVTVAHETLALFRRALQLPQDDDQFLELYVSYLSYIHASPETLRPVLEQILAINPDNENERLHLLQVLISLEDTEAIVKTCHEGTLYSPSQLVFGLYEGTSLGLLGRNAESIAALRSAASRITQDTQRELASDIQTYLGDELYEAGEKEEAYKAYDAALEYNNENIYCLNNYAYFLSLDGERLDYAETMSLRTIKAEPTNASYLDTYAWILYVQRKYPQAKIYIDEALANISTDDPSASIFDHAGDIYYRLRQTSKAVQFWVKAAGAATDSADRRKYSRKVQRRRP